MSKPLNDFADMPVTSAPIQRDAMAGCDDSTLKGELEHYYKEREPAASGTQPLIAEPAQTAAVQSGSHTNADMVICPSCAHQFRAIPENVQAALRADLEQKDSTIAVKQHLLAGCMMVLQHERDEHHVTMEGLIGLRQRAEAAEARAITAGNYSIELEGELASSKAREAALREVVTQQLFADWDARLKRMTDYSDGTRTWNRAIERARLELKHAIKTARAAKESDK